MSARLSNRARAGHRRTPARFVPPVAARPFPAASCRQAHVCPLNQDLTKPATMVRSAEPGLGARLCAPAPRRPGRAALVCARARVLGRGARRRRGVARASAHSSALALLEHLRAEVAEERGVAVVVYEEFGGLAGSFGPNPPLGQGLSGSSGSHGPTVNGGNGDNGGRGSDGWNITFAGNGGTITSVNVLKAGN
jgi:hypothetical protein